jgi:hypothetical protein
MNALPELEHHHAAIRNPCYLVRHYCRPGQRAQRAAAILEVGRAVRAAFVAFDDAQSFDVLLHAIVEGLVPREERRF